MLEVLLPALSNLFAGTHLLFMSVGVVVGLMIGVFPGLGGIAGMSLLIPFIYGMDEVSALAMLIGMVAVIPTSDTFTSVLLGIPGSSAGQATVLDGFPMSRRGEAARALASAFTSSLVGGLLGAVILTGFVLIARPLILAFGSAELFMLSVLGLSMVGVLAGRSLVKGICACGLGLVLGTVGGAPATGEFRMVYGITYLYDGVPLVVVGLALFAFPEIVELLRRDQSIAGGSKLGAGWLAGLRDWVGNWFLSLRCAGLGSIIGAVPGLGGSVVDWIAYGHCVQTSRDKSRFGTGDVRGVIAPESANNAKEGGGLLPTLLFGIPGSGSMAVFLGGLILIGIRPGPGMVTDNLPLTYSIIWSLALANVLGTGLCLALSQPIARLTTVPFPRLAPFMIVIIAFAAFQATRALADLVALLAIGVLGTLMKRFGWPRPAMLIGFVLAPQAETYLYQAVQFYGWSFAARPGVLVLAVITVLSVWFGARTTIPDSAPPETHAPESTPAEAAGRVPRLASRAALAERWPQIAFILLAGAIFAIAFFDAWGRSFLGAVFPMTVAGLMAVFAVLLLNEILTGGPDAPGLFDQERGDPDPEAGAFWGGALWIAGLVGLTGLAGFFLAMIIFLLAFLRIRAGAGWIATVTMTAIAGAVILTLADSLALNFPSGLLQAWFDLPWPIR